MMLPIASFSPVAALFLAAPDRRRAAGAVRASLPNAHPGARVAAVFSGDTAHPRNGMRSRDLPGRTRSRIRLCPARGRALRHGRSRIHRLRGGLQGRPRCDRSFGSRLPRRQHTGTQGIDATTCAVAGGSLLADGPNDMLYIFDLDNPREPRLKETRELSRPRASRSRRTATSSRSRISGTLRSSASAPGGRQCRKLLAKSIVRATTRRRGFMRGRRALRPHRAGRGSRAGISRRSGPPPRVEPLQAKGIVDIAVGDGGGMLLTDSELLLPFDDRARSRTAAGGAAREAQDR